MKRRAFTVYYDDDSMEAVAIDESASFAGLDALARADVLADAEGMVNAELAKAREALLRDMRRGRGDGAHA